MRKRRPLRTEPGMKRISYNALCLAKGSLIDSIFRSTVFIPFRYHRVRFPCVILSLSKHTCESSLSVKKRNGKKGDKSNDEDKVNKKQAFVVVIDCL